MYYTSKTHDKEVIKLEFKNTSPIYVQIMDIIRGSMASNQLKTGEKLPSVRDYSKELKVNPNTVQRAYQELERQGLVYTQRGLGTYISQEEGLIEDLRLDLSKAIIEKFFKDMETIGYSREKAVEILKRELIE